MLELWAYFNSLDIWAILALVLIMGPYGRWVVFSYNGDRLLERVLAMWLLVVVLAIGLAAFVVSNMAPTLPEMPLPSGESTDTVIGWFNSHFWAELSPRILMILGSGGAYLLGVASTEWWYSIRRNVMKPEQRGTTLYLPDNDDRDDNDQKDYR